MRIRERFAVILGHLRGTATFVALRVTPIAFLVMLALPARAQFIGFTSPQTVTSTPFNAVVPTPNQSVVLQNLGQNIHFVSYTINGPIANVLSFGMRLEGSLDGVTFFPISADITTGNVSASSGALYAVGYFPVIRLKVLDFQDFNPGSCTLSAQYSGTSSTSGPMLGSYSAAQVNSKALWTNASAGATQHSAFFSPTGSTLGYIMLYAPMLGMLPAGGTLSVSISGGGNFVIVFTTTIAAPLGTALPQIFAIPNVVANSGIEVSYSTGGASATLINASYFFVPPGDASTLGGPNTQPISFGGIPQRNTETSAVASSATVTITDSAIVRTHLFSVSARCSAGTSGITVTDGSTSGTQIWSTGAAEVGTTTFRYQWDPGLASRIGKGMVITLTTCGGGNTGTLDVQASQF